MVIITTLAHEHMCLYSIEWHRVPHYTTSTTMQIITTKKPMLHPFNVHIRNDITKNRQQLVYMS